MAETIVARPDFKPYVPDEARLPELTLRAVLLGSFLGITTEQQSIFVHCGFTLSIRAERKTEHENRVSLCDGGTTLRCGRCGFD